MKLIIDIPYGLKDVYEHGNVTALDVEEMKRALQNGTPIPDNATRYDIAKLFYGTDDAIDLFNELQMGKDWWNAPYQKGGKE